MTDATGSTLDSSSRRATAARGQGLALLHLAFTAEAFAAGERCAAGEEGLLLGRGEPLFARTALDDPRISRRHARIERAGSGWVLVDLGSHNGTRRNGKPVDGSAPLAWGDVIRIGNTLLVFTGAAPGLPEEPDPAPGLVGVGPAMAGVRRAIGQVAGHGHSVLILGETGTGKEVIARALHHRSGRAGDFVAINCGSVPETVLDSELFGHARGAFTGAISRRGGLFQAAEGGTLFLDELGEMSSALQVKLLRALETRQIRPVGSTQEVPVDVRVLAATHRDVVADVREGRFRADLYARLAQWFISVPPLRERREDITPLAGHLLERLGAAGRQVDPDLAETLLLHDWPLNVRGLLNVLSMAAIASGGGRLALDPQVEQALEAERRIATGGPEPFPAEPPRRKPEARELEELLEAQRGNVAEVARLLGCSRQQVYRWRDELGLELSRYRRDGGRH